MGKTDKKEIIDDEKVIIIDIDLASDVKDFILKNIDVQVSPELKTKIDCSKDCDLLKVTKQIASPTTIIAVETITEEYVQKNLFTD